MGQLPVSSFSLLIYFDSLPHLSRPLSPLLTVLPFLFSFPLSPFPFCLFFLPFLHLYSLHLFLFDSPPLLLFLENNSFPSLSLTFCHSFFFVISSTFISSTLSCTFPFLFSGFSVVRQLPQGVQCLKQVSRLPTWRRGVGVRPRDLEAKGGEEDGLYGGGDSRGRADEKG